MEQELSPRVKEYFARPDAATQWWKITVETGGRYGRQLGFLSQHLTPQGMRVLDAATGQGRFAIHCAKSGASRVLAADISSGMISQAKTNALRHRVDSLVEFIHSDISELNLEKGSVDLITFMEVLVHLPQPNWVLQRLTQFLVRGGHLLLNFDYPQAERITYPIDRIHAVLRSTLKGRAQSALVMHHSVDETIAALDTTKPNHATVMRPRDAYRGLPVKTVESWIQKAGLHIIARRREYPRLFGLIPIPIPIGQIMLCRKI